MKSFYNEVEDVLHKNILAFWQNNMIDPQGGFFGEFTGMGKLMKDAPKGAVLNARILWAFSAAYRMTGNPEYLTMATRAKDYLLENFYDNEFGGIYWSLTADGNPLDTKKQIYAIGFAIYGLSEYVRITNSEEALDYAIKLYQSIEQYSYDNVNNGYFEAFTREWKEMGDVRLSDKDANECKTMNTHLHILEPYTNLYRVWRNEELKLRIQNLLGIFMDKIYDPTTNHLGLFFNEEWLSKDAGYSYGHDIEASWLMLEAAQVIGNPSLLTKTKSITKKIANAADEGRQEDGSMIYEMHPNGRLDYERHWWVQAEAVVGYLWLWHYQDDELAFNKSLACWEYIKTHIIDFRNGEWWWGAMADGTADKENDKAGFWKCPYHNTRMCLEVMDILSRV